MPSAATDQAPEPAASAELSALEVEVIGLFVNAVKLLGMPKSVGEIYGLLYISPVPLPLDSLVGRLNISKGSASQGLKVLRAFGAVKQVYVARDRRDHYSAETELKKLAAGFIREEIKPRMDSGAQRLERLRALCSTEETETAEHYRNRVSKLGQWHARSGEILRLLTTVLD